MPLFWSCNNYNLIVRQGQFIFLIICIYEFFYIETFLAKMFFCLLFYPVVLVNSRFHYGDTENTSLVCSELSFERSHPRIQLIHMLKTKKHYVQLIK